MFIVLLKLSNKFKIKYIGIEHRKYSQENDFQMFQNWKDIEYASVRQISLQSDSVFLTINNGIVFVGCFLNQFIVKLVLHCWRVDVLKVLLNYFWVGNDCGWNRVLGCLRRVFKRNVEPSCYRGNVFSNLY